jgi:hypothetical protein
MLPHTNINLRFNSGWAEVPDTSMVTLQVVDEVPYLLRQEGWDSLPAWVEATLADGILTLWGPQRAKLGTADASFLVALRRSNSIFLAQPSGKGMSIQGEAVIVA